MASKNKEKEEEPRIPVFTVLKNGAILKNIFIVNNNNNTCSTSNPTGDQVLIIGRHPNCNIMLTHPSISRFHLKIISDPSSRTLSVIDLSSVHGTWISEQKIEPFVRVELHEGDSLRIGGSSRVYRLHWIPLSQAYDVETSYVSTCDLVMESEKKDHMAVEAYQDENSVPIDDEPVEEDVKTIDVEVEMEMEEKKEDEGNNFLFHENKEIQSWDPLGDLSYLFSESLVVTAKKEISVEPLMPDHPIYSIFDEDEECVESPLKVASEENVILSRCDNEHFKSVTATFESFSLGNEQSLDDFYNVESLSHSPMQDDVLGEQKPYICVDFHHPASETPKGIRERRLAEGEELEAVSVVESVKSSFPAENVTTGIMDDRENQTPLSQYKANGTAHLAAIKSSPVKSDDKENCGSIWSRRGKPENALQLQTEKISVEKQLELVDSEDGSHNQENMENKSALEEGFTGSDEEKDEIFTPDKENFTPNTYLGKSLNRKAKLFNSDDMKNSQECAEDKLILNENHSSLDGEEDDIFTPDKENFTPHTYLVKSLQRKGKLFSSDGENQCAEDALILKENKSSSDGIEIEIFTPDKENFTPNTYIVKSLGRKGKLDYSDDAKSNQDCAEDSSTLKANCSFLDGEEDEEFTPDKENFTPNPILPKFSRKKLVLGERKLTKPSRLSPLKVTSSSSTRPEKTFDSSLKNENQASRVLQELKPPTSGNKVRLERELLVKKNRPVRAPFQSLVEKSGNNIRLSAQRTSSSTKTSLSINCPQTMDKKFTNRVSNTSVRQSKKAWIMVADIGTLLNKQSRKNLKLLQGLKQTSLVIPRMVLKELDAMKQRGCLFRRKTEACLVLEWIEQCMIETPMWIRVQSSAEDGRLTAATPPASPQTPFSSDMSISSLPFSRRWSFAEILSPTTEDHILECALTCRKVNSDRQAVLLSDDLTVKIKAMAEGLICETVQEFRESLINPFSERFLWAESSPRGQTWSIEDDIVLREKYDYWSLKRQLKGESAKGLKLILLHNSHYSHKMALVS